MSTRLKIACVKSVDELRFIFNQLNSEHYEFCPDKQIIRCLIDTPSRAHIYCVWRGWSSTYESLFSISESYFMEYIIDP